MQLCLERRIDIEEKVPSGSQDSRCVCAHVLVFPVRYYLFNEQEVLL